MVVAVTEITIDVNALRRDVGPQAGCAAPLPLSAQIRPCGSQLLAGRLYFQSRLVNLVVELTKKALNRCRTLESCCGFSCPS